LQSLGRYCKRYVPIEADPRRKVKEEEEDLEDEVVIQARGI
jgi:hypothetical protein